jgi:hypothetical protein
MIPNTRETIRRIRKSSASASASESVDDHTQPTLMSTSDSTGVFMSSKFRNMYARPEDSSMLVYHVGDGAQKEYNYTYPFENQVTPNALPETFDASAFYSRPCTIHICMYRICKDGHTFPYLQFKLKVDSKKRQLMFPSFSYQFSGSSSDDSSSDSDNNGCVKKANERIAQWLKDDGALDGIEFRGIYHCQHQSAVSDMRGGRRKFNRNRHMKMNNDAANDNDNDTHDSEKSSDSESGSGASSRSDSLSEYSDSSDRASDNDVLYMVYEDTSRGDDRLTSRVSYKSEWWWACVHEVYNTRRVLFHRIGRNVTSLFESEPSALFLMNDAGNVYETPHVLYKGRPSEVSLDEMCAFGPRKCIDDNNVSSSRERVHAEKNINEILMHGSHYYLYEFCDALRGACYAYDDVANKYKKMHTGPHCLFRYVVFLGKTKTIMFDTTGSTNHDRFSRAHMYREREWPTAGYNSIYHGKYRAPESGLTSGGGGKRGGGTLLYPAFSVADVHRVIGASYHEVDAATIPDDINSILKGKQLVKFK